MFQIVEQLVEFIRHCLRVARVATKPNSYEYISAVKITGLGILIIGSVGFLVYMIFQLLQLP